MSGPDAPSPAGARWQETDDLDPSNVVGFLASRGITLKGPLVARSLAGGVSSIVIAVDGADRGVVVKRARARLRVDAVWRAKRERSLTEAAALRFVRSITPDRVPRLIDIDPRSLTLVVERAPIAARNWREITLEAPANPAIGVQLGQTLASWHRATGPGWGRAAEFDDAEAFEQLRLRPFHGAAAAKNPAYASQIRLHADQLRATKRCLVHGDFSPKNVLVAPSLLWIVDFEVAHVGHPIFDVAFLGAHLALTAIARHSHAPSLGATWLAFHDTYQRLAPPTPLVGTLSSHVACLVLSRLDGLSPEPDLLEHQTAQARSLAGRLFSLQSNNACALWDAVADAIR